MKAFKLIGAAAAASLLLLTSCLGESNNTVTRAGFGVAGLSEKTYKTVLNTNMGALYSPSLSAQVVDGACYLINYELDLNSPENANAATNGYLTATISVADEITKGQPVFYNVPDSASLLQNEKGNDEAAGFDGAGMEGFRHGHGGLLRLSRIWLPRGESGCVWRMRPRHPDLRHGHRHRHCGEQGEGHARLHLFGRVQRRAEQAPQQQQHPDDGCARRRR